MQNDTYKKACERLNSYIASHGMRHTIERERILQAIVQHKGAFTVDHLIEWLEGEQISQATIYNTLNLLVEACILQCLKRQHEARKMQYELALTGGRYIQIFCTHCGRVARVLDKSIDNAIQTKRFANFKMNHYSVYVYGTCEQCRKTNH